MAFKLGDRIRENTTTTGTGDLLLAGADVGFSTFASRLSNGDTTWYALVFGAHWEIGVGTFTAPSTLARTTVIASTNADAALNLTAGTKEVFITAPAQALALLAELQAVPSGYFLGRNTAGPGLVEKLSPAVSRAMLGLTQVPRGHLFGLTISNNASDATNDIDFAAGEAASDDAISDLMALGSLLTKRLDAAWAVGSGNGGLDTGSIADGIYHAWLIKRSDTGVVDALLSSSATSPTMPADYDRKRRLGSFIRNAGAVVAFVQTGDKFLFRQPFSTSAATTTSASLLTLPGFPTGLKLEPIIAAWNLAGASITYLSSPDTTDLAPSATGFPGFDIRVAAGGAIPSSSFIANHLMTNTSAQIRHRSSAADGTLYVSNRGWIDLRGRLG